jgi:L-lactate dehydrogenase complex protein LldG
MVAEQMTISGREQVLGAVARALASSPPGLATQPAPTSITGATDDKAALARLFCVELVAVSAVGTVVRDLPACATEVAKFLRGRGARSIAAQASPLAAELSSLVEGFDRRTATDLTKVELEQVDCAMLEARSLLADTGSAIVVLDSAQDRVLPYLPRTCVIVASMQSLHPTLTEDALACVNDAALAGARGEALIITGPSKSGDIEKTLVLGAHGPEAVAVFIVEHT